jgi:RNA polymerase sigma-70 factor (sigma-E family)
MWGGGADGTGVEPEDDVAASDSFDETYRAAYPRVVRSAWRLCRDQALAEELAQEAFVRAYRRWSRLTRTGTAEPWVHRAATNLALDAVARRRRGRELEALAQRMSLPPDQIGGPPGVDRRLADLLGQLSRRQREAVVLRHVADLGEEQVASLMGCSTGTVKVHTSRGLARLRELTDPAPHGEEAARWATTPR